MKFKYCPLCGRKLELKDSWDEGAVPFCEHDDTLFFDLPKPCAVIAVIKEKEILLLKQSYIYKNSKVLVSGYVGVDETVEQTVAREVMEETGIQIENIEYLGSDFVYGKELLMLTFMAKYKSGDINKSSEVEALEWIPLEKALAQMEEDAIGKKVVKKILEKYNY
ncbi:NAD(+) diphosphatase [Clostridium sp. 'White wine YQ']|uniref:NAD(+) diphosphatase n=1 Tax=Clostridium sp. 'White wine YQ' TaxID=3027474 RepID=UPI002365C35D|nr:NUDIX domain-containing protein [Clostridium sp. 'White wine YQ']MDD7795033.1 NUDIX domain-containing protein [Clostridium sp. 'White wine YQ']